MNLVWSLICKDQRNLRWWLTVWIGTQLILSVGQWVVWFQRGESYPHLILGPAGVVLLLFIPFMTAMVIQQDPVNRSNTFWTTRPLQPKHLLLGKLIFVGIYLVLLPAVMRGALYAALGFGPHWGLAMVEWAVPHLMLVFASVALASLTEHPGRVFLLLICLPIVATLLQTLARWTPWFRNTCVIIDSPWVVVLVLVSLCLVVTTSAYLKSPCFARIAAIAGVGLLVIVDVPRSEPMVAGLSSNASLDALGEGFRPGINLVSDWEIDSSPGMVTWRRSVHQPDGVRLAIEARMTEWEARGRVWKSVGNCEPDEAILYRKPTAEELQAFLGGRVLPKEEKDGWFQDILHLARPFDESVRGARGELRGKCWLIDLQPQCYARFPVVKGRVHQSGAWRLTISRVASRPDGFLELSVNAQQVKRSRHTALSWKGTPFRELRGENYYLFHRQRGICLPALSSRRAYRMSEMSFERERVTLAFQHPGMPERLENLAAWELVVFGFEPVAAKRVSFAIPNIQFKSESD